MAVVRSGDAEPTALHPDVADPAPSQPSQTEWDSIANNEPFALADDHSMSATGDATRPKDIPPPPPIPIDLVQRVHSNRQRHEDPATLSRLVDRERETPPPKVAAEATTESNRDFVPSNASRTIHDIHKQPISDSRGRQGLAAQERRKYSPIAVALASMLLVSAVVFVLRGKNHNDASRNVQAQPRVEPAPQELAPFKPSNARAVAPEPNATATAAPAAESASVAPAASVALGTTRVTLDLSPIDAKVYIRGREIPGPPFAFDVAKDERLAVEVQRLGFATAKVVLDDKKPSVHFGMLREHGAKAR